MAKELRQIVRISGFDLDGTKSVGHQLTRVKGVGVSYANAICIVLSLNKSIKSGELSDEQLAKIEKVLADPHQFKIPEWMLNRKKDPETGENRHLVGSDLKFIQDNDIKMMRKIRCYKGIRHSQGLPVRGQKTKSNFRRNKGKAMGVHKKK
jgi:small subunit ribosomal protein S13